MMILSIDPGNKQSAYALMDENLKPVQFGIVENTEMFIVFENSGIEHFVIEMVASFGMPVGETTFETVFWIGRFWQALPEDLPKKKIYRLDVKLNLCHDSRAKDGNIRQALIDRFGPVGVKKNPGWFYGVKKDIWSAIACGVTYYDLYLNHRKLN